MGVHQAQAAQAGRPGAAGQFRDGHAPGVAHQYHEHPALAVQNHGHLPRQAARQGGQFSGLIQAVAPNRGITAGVQPFQGFNLAGLQALQVSVNFTGYDPFLWLRRSR